MIFTIPTQPSWDSVVSRVCKLPLHVPWLLATKIPWSARCLLGRKVIYQARNLLLMKHNLTPSLTNGSCPSKEVPQQTNKQTVTICREKAEKSQAGLHLLKSTVINTDPAVPACSGFGSLRMMQLPAALQGTSAMIIFLFRCLISFKS